VVPAGDAKALADCLRSALDGSAALPSRTACRAYAEQFSWSRVAAEHARIYHRARNPRRERALRVVYLDHCARLSGAEIALLRLLPVLRGVEPHVILGEHGPLVARLLQAGISVEVLPLSRAARDVRREAVVLRSIPLSAALSSAIYAARVAVRLRRLRPDLVHTNSLKAALYGGAAGKLAGIPVVWHARDRIAEDYLPESAVRFARAAARALPTGVIAVSEATLETLGDMGRRPVRVIRDPVAFSMAPDGRDGEPLRVGLVGRIAPWKGQHVFLEAFVRAFPEGDERAVLVGAPLFGESEYEQRLHGLAAELGLTDRCEFRGFREDVSAELARLDLLVHASVIPEPGGQVVVEGLAAGMPVIATTAGGPAEIIRAGVDGLLCPPDDVDALAHALRRLAADPGLRQRLGAAARLAAARFEPNEIGRQVAEFYNRVLAASNGSSP
jgi:glycosyltransferase involved in cell wall biosynthesis